MISAVVISKNEAHNIKRAIESLSGLVDEIILIDSESTDQTASIAESLGAKVFVRAWQGYGATKNFGNDKAKYDWILSLDADEEVSPKLKEEIISLSKEDKIAYNIRIVMNYLGKILRFTEYNPHYKPRLFNKNYYQWDERVVHEKLVAKKVPKVLKKLSNDIFHYSFKDEQHHRSKLDLYAQLSAKELMRKHKRPSIFKRCFGPFYRFFRSYILKLGFLEGKEGWRISVLAGQLVKKRHQYFDVYSE